MKFCFKGFDLNKISIALVFFSSLSAQAITQEELDLIYARIERLEAKIKKQRDAVKPSLYMTMSISDEILMKALGKIDKYEKEKTELETIIKALLSSDEEEQNKKPEMKQEQEKEPSLPPFSPAHQLMSLPQIPSGSISAVSSAAIELPADIIREMNFEEFHSLDEETKGRVIDQYIARPEVLSQALLDSLFDTEKRSPFQFHEYQYQDDGQCGRHAINNALGEVFADEAEFKTLMASLFDQICSNIDVNNKDDFGSDPEQLQFLLQESPKKIKTTRMVIKNLPGFSAGKVRALRAFLETTRWMIIANTAEKNHRLPGKPMRKAISIGPGHFVAARKDGRGQWWLIDSEIGWQIPIPLFLLEKDLTLIIPQRES